MASVNFINTGTGIEAKTPAGSAILQLYLESKSLPKPDGALGFSTESDSLELIFQDPVSAQTGQILLESLIN